MFTFASPVPSKSCSCSISSVDMILVGLGIPAWNASTTLKVGGQTITPVAGAYATIDRVWPLGDQIESNGLRPASHLNYTSNNGP